MAMQLSPYRLGKARDVYNYFNVFNAISWNLCVGIIITLFALRMGATSTYIGLLSAAFYIALFLLPLGKILAKRFSIIGIFSFTWIARSLCMILAVAAPFFDYAGYRNTALLLIMAGVILFHLFRGVGMIGNNPVLGLLASGPDRGSYMTQIQIINSAIGMSSSFIIAMILGMEPPIFIFSILLAAGVVTGVISGYMIRKVPEPAAEKEGHGSRLRQVFKDAFSQDSLRNFMFILFLVIMVSGVTRTFVVVYAREVFEHNDGLISLYSVFGGLGYLMAGLIVKFLVDRIGAKPLFLVCVGIGLVSIIPVVFIPQAMILNVTGAILFMVFLFFMINFGFLGSEGIAQTYFFALVPQEKMLNMGIVYFFIFGAAGAGGSLLAGFLLDMLRVMGMSSFASFRVLFIVLITLALTALAMHRKMKSLGSLPLKGALEVIFSFRDLRAISILDKLNKAQDSNEEQILIGELHNTPSHLAIGGLLERARSPRLETRFESIRALEKLESLNDKAENALIDDIINNPFTTAYISARILGNNKCTAAIPLLRELAVSDDYMLAGEALIALAKMKDEAFRSKVERLIRDTKNPRLMIMGSEALGLFGNTDSIPVLLNILRGDDPPPYLRDEVLLAIATILEIQKMYYRILVRYRSDKSLAHTLAMDEVESALEFITSNEKKILSKDNVSSLISHAGVFQRAVEKYLNDKDGTEMSHWILDIPNEYSKSRYAIKSILSKAVLDNDLIVFNSLRLLIIHWAAQELRIWGAKVK